MAAMAAQQNVQIKDFLQGTRRDRALGSTVAIPINGGTATANLLQNGLTTRLRLKIVLQANTNTTAPAWGNSLEQALSWIKNITIKNSQGLTVMNISGYGLRMLLAKTKRGYDFLSAPGTAVALPGVSSAFVWAFVIPLDISFNESLQYQLGLIYTMTSTAQWSVNVTFDALANIITATTLSAITAQMSVSQEWYEKPSDTPSERYTAPDMSYANIIDEQVVTAGLPSAGNFEYELSPLNGEQIRLLSQYVYGAGPASYAGAAKTNGLVNPAGGTAFISQAYLKIATNINAETHDPFVDDADYYRTYGSTPFPGEIVHLDGATSMGYPNEFMRPYYVYQQLNAAAVPSVKLGAALNANGAAWAYYRVVRNYAQKISYQNY